MLEFSEIVNYIVNIYFFTLLLATLANYTITVAFNRKTQNAGSYKKLSTLHLLL